MSKLNTLIKEVTENLERFELGIAVQKLYDFIWDVLCDWYIELTKSRIQAGGESAKSAQQVLIYVMNQCLKLLHPIMPFITEEIWQAIPNDCESIMVAPWPQYREDLCFQQEEEDFEKVMSAIKAIRNRRAEMNVPPSKKARVFVKTLNTGMFESGAMFIERLASASEVKVSGVAPQQGEDFSDAVQVITDSARIFIPLDELVDKEKELARLEKERKACDKDIAMVEQKLSSQGFIEKAPQNVVEAERAKLEKHKERMEKIVESIAAFSK